MPGRAGLGRSAFDAARLPLGITLGSRVAALAFAEKETGASNRQPLAGGTRTARAPRFREGGLTARRQ